MLLCLKKMHVLIHLCPIAWILLILCSCMQAVYVLFRDDHVMKLPYFIAIAGIACGLFAISIPHLSALRIWLAISTLFSMVYFSVAIALSLKDGKPAASQPNKYQNFCCLTLLTRICKRSGFS